jgi:hypothetical protein
MKLKIALLILVCATACSDKPATIVLPVSFYDKMAFEILDWKVTQNSSGKKFTAKGIGFDEEQRDRYWRGQTNHHEFSCSWGTNTSGENSGNILIEYVYYEDTTVMIVNMDWDTGTITDTTYSFREVERRKTIAESDLDKHSAYRPIVKALAKQHP